MHRFASTQMKKSILSIYPFQTVLVWLVRDTCTAHERHLCGSRETLARLASDTCTAQTGKSRQRISLYFSR